MILRAKIGRLAATLVLAMTALAVRSQAQVLNSGAQAITLNAVLNDSLSVTLSANAANFTMTAGSASNPGSTSITSTTTWISKPGRNLSLYAYFANSATALTDGAGDNIPSANFEVSDNAGPFTALTNTVPFGGANAGLTIFTQKITGLNKTGSKTDTLNFNINLSTLPNLPAGTYTGTVTIQAQII